MSDMRQLIETLSAGRFAQPQMAPPSQPFVQAGQGLNSLLSSLPPQPIPDWSDTARQAHGWVTRNMLEPAQYAGMYPARVLERAFPDWPVPRHDKPGRKGIRRALGEGSKYGGALPIREIDAMGTYVPGNRQADIEDRRPRSIWEY